jgi:phytoene dehydrogenase-like protein
MGMKNEEALPTNPVAIVGGGLAGLTALAFLARAKIPAVLFERSETIGGRAKTEDVEGFAINLGAHALYRTGAARKALDELGVRVSGAKPKARGGYAVIEGKKHTLPSGFISLIATDILPLAGKLEFGRLSRLISRPETAEECDPPWSFSQWIDRSVENEALKAMLLMLFRVTTYSTRPDAFSARAALTQLRLGLFDGVDYLDGGWRTIAEGLERFATEAGGIIARGVRVEKIEHDGAVRAIHLEDGRRIPVVAAILAMPPRAIIPLVSGSAKAWCEAQVLRAVPATVACLDVALDRLTDPKTILALGIDRPTYGSVHSATAKLAPSGGGALVQLMKYGSDGSDPTGDKRELEALLELMQPGWRGHVIHARFLPSMVAAHAISRPSTAEPRASGPVPDVANLFVAGDWVGEEHHLADASCASARDAAKRIEDAALERARDAA